MNRRQPQQGFTLIELMVAMTIFALMSLMAYQGMQSVFAAREQTDADARRLQAIQMTFLVLQRDLEFISEREIRDQYGDRQPAFKLAEDGDFRLELTRDGFRNPAQLPRSSLQRVAYQVSDKGLYRVRWSVLDRAPDSPVIKRRLLDDVTELSIRVLDEKDEWQTAWPMSAQSHAFPRAVEVSVTFADWGRLSRLFVLPEAN